MTDQTQQDALGAEVEFRLSKKAKCVCPDVWPARICDHFIPDGILCCEICGHLEACHTFKQEANQ